MSYPQRIVGYVVLPFQKILNFVVVKINYSYMYFHDIGMLKDQNEKLSNKVQELNENQRYANNLKAENERLRNMLDLKQEYNNYDLESAQVIGRNAENWSSIILINKGTESGIKVDSQVISHNKGLIGRVIDVAPNWAKVMLITDSDSSVSSMIDRTRDLTVVRGDSVASKDGYVKLSYILPDAEIATNDEIVTSGYGGIFSKGLLIGKVVEIKNESNELTKYALVEPTADFKRIEEVLVIKDIKE